MKVSIEVREDGKFEFEYEVGKNKSHGTTHYGVEHMNMLMQLIGFCHKQFNKRTEEEINEIHCMAYIEKHPEIVERFVKLEKKRKRRS